MAQRFAGVATLTVDQEQMKLHGNFMVSPSSIERTMVAGQDTIHGYQELPRVPFIEGDISAMPNVRLEKLTTQVNVTVVAQLANNMQYTLQNAICKCGFEENTRDGTVKVRWEGVNCEEMPMTGGTL